MTKPEEKKAIPESDNPTDRRIQLDRRCGITDRRIKQTDNPTARQIQLNRRSGKTDRRIQPDRRRSITDDITDYRIGQIEGVKAKRKWYEKILSFIFVSKNKSIK